MTIDNWESAESKDSLKSLKSESLKNILSLKGLSITGSKQVLMDRVWGIISGTVSQNSESTKKAPEEKI